MCVCVCVCVCMRAFFWGFFFWGGVCLFVVVYSLVCLFVVVVLEGLLLFLFNGFLSFRFCLFVCLLFLFLLLLLLLFEGSGWGGIKTPETR